MEVFPKVLCILVKQPSDKADNVNMEAICRYPHGQGWQCCQRNDAICKTGGIARNMDSLDAHV